MPKKKHKKVKVVLLPNRKAKFLKEPPEGIEKYFSYTNKGAFFAHRFRGARWNGSVRLLTEAGYVGTGLFQAMRETIEKEMKIRFVVDDQRPTVKFDAADNPSDREYQNKIVRSMVRASRAGESGLILGATGVGKTRIAGMFFRRLRGTGIFIVDELQLLYQTKRALEKVLGEKVGVLGDQKVRIRRITVATIQTLSKHKKKKSIEGWARSVEATLIDEFHLALNKRIYQTMLWMQPKVVFGLTATLELQKKDVRLRAYRTAGPVIYQYKMKAAKKEGYLAKGVAVSVVRRVSGRGEDYREAYKKMIVGSKTRNHIIQELAEEAHRRGRSVIILVERIRHLHILSKRLRRIPHRLVYGVKTPEERIAAKKKFEKKHIRLLIANKVFKKGIDIPSIDCIIDGAGMSSKNDAVQKYGRGIRLSEGKDGLLYFDVSDWSPKGVRKKEPGWNRFQLASQSRRRALKKEGIKLVILDWERNAKRVLDRAERALKAA